MGCEFVTEKLLAILDSIPWTHTYTWIIVGVVVFLPPLVFLILRWLRQRRFVETDEFAETLQLLGRKLDEKSFAFLTHRLDTLTAETRKLVDKRFNALRGVKAVPTMIHALRKRGDSINEWMERISEQLESGEDDSFQERVDQGVARVQEESRSHIETLKKSLEASHKRQRDLEAECENTRKELEDSREESRQLDEMAARLDAARESIATLERALSKVTSSRSEPPALGEGATVADSAKIASSDATLVEAQRVDQEDAVLEEQRRNAALAKKLRSVVRQTRSLRAVHQAFLKGACSSPAFAVNRDLTVFVWNQAAEELWNRPSSEVLGKRLKKGTVGSDSLYEQVVSNATAAMESCQSRVVPKSNFVLFEDRQLELSIRYEPICDEHGQAVGAIVAAVEDVAPTEDSRFASSSGGGTDSSTDGKGRGSDSSRVTGLARQPQASA